MHSTNHKPQARPALRRALAVRQLLPALVLATMGFAASSTPLAAQTAETGSSDQQKIRDLAKDTAPGQWFPEVQVPKDLAGMREAMLRYGNVVRRDPEYRRKAGATQFTDTNALQVGTERVFRDVDTAPYFTKDLVLNEKFNQVAQWFAEESAAAKRSGHNASATYRAPDGKTYTMVHLGDRATAFGIPAGNMVEITGASGDPGDFPRKWLTGDTHYKWFWGVGGRFPEVGFGAAKGADGGWYFVGVARWYPALVLPDAAKAKNCTSVLTDLTPFKEGALDAMNCIRSNANPKIVWDDGLAATAAASAQSRINGSSASDPKEGFASSIESPDPNPVMQIYKNMDSFKGASGATAVGCGTAMKEMIHQGNRFYHRGVACRFR